ncbi:hypothetical protein [Allokutzneria multivorans]|uniref:toxin-antitoxin system YwqK family antitoxin n=1 Tax=Allokutzneria multivorans TaxID=1142134 RepID=UPI0031EB21CE
MNFDDTIRDEFERRLYQDEPFTGEVVETAEDGFVLSLNNYRDGWEEGVQREWYYEGRLRSEYWIVGGKLFGESKEWHENGQLAVLQVWNEHGALASYQQWDEHGRPTEP